MTNISLTMSTEFMCYDLLLDATFQTNSISIKTEPTV